MVLLWINHLISRNPTQFRACCASSNVLPSSSTGPRICGHWFVMVPLWIANTGLGFDKAAWFKAYVQDRQTRPLEPGKIRRNPISNARRVLNWVLDSAAPTRCLETNIYSAPTEQASHLAAQQRITAPFNFLLETIGRKVIVAHGKGAAKHIEHMTCSTCVIRVPSLFSWLVRNHAVSKPKHYAATPRLGYVAATVKWRLFRSRRRAGGIETPVCSSSWSAMAFAMLINHMSAC
jgi:hypothetical protein